MTKETLTSLALVLVFFVTTEVSANQTVIASDTINYKANIANTLQQKLQDPEFKQDLFKQLSRSNAPVLFSNVMANQLSRSTMGVLDSALTQGIYPEIWLYQPDSEQKLSDANKLFIAYAPKGDEKQWQYIPAIDVTTGEAVQLDVNQAPEAPVIVVETHGQYSMQNFINDINLQLGNMKSAELSTFVAPKAVFETTKLTKISLQDDKEPWIKGGAEIFTFVAGVFDDNAPAVKAVGLPYLDYDKTDYYPNQLIINWNDYKYNVVNFSMYEEDSETNYKELSKVIVTAIGAIGTLAGLEPSMALAEITNRIQDAMPDSWYTDDHDYVDTCYTLVKGQSLDNEWCAAHNARISTQPFNIQSN